MHETAIKGEDPTVLCARGVRVYQPAFELDVGHYGNMASVDHEKTGVHRLVR